MWRAITSTLYLVPLVVRRYRQAHPREQVLAAGACKMVERRQDEPAAYGPHWILARRGTAILSDTHLVCGRLRLALEDVAQATVVELRTLLAKGMLLKVATRDGRHLQLGLQHDPAWTAQRVLPVTVEQGRVQHSWASVLLRVGILSLLAYSWWSRRG